jgi:hypothetical protein
MPTLQASQKRQIQFRFTASDRVACSDANRGLSREYGLARHYYLEPGKRGGRKHAKANGFMLVSQDSDFADMAAHYGHPPKVIWLRCGNQRVAAVETVRIA